jgi:hypothetical protein
MVDQEERKKRENRNGKKKENEKKVLIHCNEIESMVIRRENLPLTFLWPLYFLVQNS